MVKPEPSRHRRLCFATIAAIVALIALPFFFIAHLNNRSR